MCMLSSSPLLSLRIALRDAHGVRTQGVGNVVTGAERPAESACDTPCDIRSPGAYARAGRGRSAARERVGVRMPQGAPHTLGRT